jgi:hypothetical protein
LQTKKLKIQQIFGSILRVNKGQKVGKMADLDARKSRSQFAKRFEDFGALEQPQNVGKSLKKNNFVYLSPHETRYRKDRRWRLLDLLLT